MEVKVLDMDRIRRETGRIRGAWLGLRRLWGKRTVSIFIGMLGLEKDELTEIIERGIIASERTRLGFSPAPPKIQPGVD